MANIVRAHALDPVLVKEYSQLSMFLQDARCLPAAVRKSPADVCLVLLTGHELGIGPAQALRDIHIIEGKPSLSASLMVALVLRSGCARYFRLVETTPQSATYETQRHGEPGRQQLTFTIQEARQAGLLDRGKSDEMRRMNNWNRYPSAMLRARAKSSLAREVYPDVLAGFYTPDELDNEQPVAADEPFAAVEKPVVVSPDEPEAVLVYDGEVPTEAEIISGVPDREEAANALETAMRDAASIKELVALLPAIGDLPEEAKERLRPIYQKCRAQFTTPQNGALNGQ